MNDGVADAILYEGYMLYPYRPSALKNQRRWTFGALEPGAENLLCEFLVQATPATRLQAWLRYFTIVGDEPHRSEVAVGPFTIDAPATTDRLRTSVEPLADAASRVHRVHRVHVEVANPGPRLMASSQVLVTVDDGAFVPPRDPPAPLQAAADACRNRGLWPILVGEPDDRRRLLCSPIIVDDYAQVAPESPHAFFDATEIDELLALRIQSLASSERQEIAASSDAMVRDLLDQATSMGPEQLARLHGARRPPAVGQHVRLLPSRRADILDLVLAGREATVVAIEHDLEQRTYVAVTIDDDPGNDLGASGRPGHRFFFMPDEVVAID